MHSSWFAAKAGDAKGTRWTFDGLRRAICLLVVCATGPSAWAANAPVQLLMGVPVGLPGYEVQEGGSLKINDPVKRSLTECIGSRLNAKFTWVSYPTRRVIQMLQTQELDMIFPMGFTTERAATMQQSQPTWQSPDVFVSMHPVDMRDKSLRIVARLGSPQHTDYVAEGYSNVSGAYSYAELARLLERGQVDVVIVPRPIYEEQKDLWPRGAMVSDGRPRGTGFYVNKDDPKALLKPLNESIARCRKAAGLK